ncbi:YIEGIA family protein [Clostridium beijerinckii]|uniref:YIEGIA protein n=1 Tax=Clostridium beijerinckii TaxID=1520 RepID=A0A1S9N556_CLOBE|nr:YIEGIA family protein [Clostridium beijerinckii]MZK51102.1 YIEGIA protein [Clostridium beijerinckii]MZK59304.1 YIEGIA protein [Clostridium beijerinckii]MZK69423.1 YIEGIA protein [Clostridium beijerinckii]MZK74796.1 YIEGIA protein [Clostridium beijerinckii]MZK84514.1 YIEGIA protein [Clostridium beijerinckii]
MREEFISQQYIVLIVTAIIMGSLARILTIIQDYRQYPSYPNGYLINAVTGVIAAALGAVAVPALMTKNFTAITFLSVAIQQFRDVRKVEKESLKALDDTEYAKKGDAYIDGIAKTYEARNYFALVVSIVTGITIQVINSKIIWINILSGCIVGTIAFLILRRFSKGHSIGDIAEVKLGKIEVRGSELYVDDMFVTNYLGTDNSRKLVQAEGIAAVIYPKNEHYRITLDNFGQRQAILFEVCRRLGVKRYNYTRKEYKTGRIAIAIVPLVRDEGAFIETINKTPLLENVKKNKELMKNPLENE